MIEIRDKKAYIVGRGHLKAEMVARMVTDGHYSVQETMAHYALTAGQVHAALAYYYDNQDELDAARDARAQHIAENVIDSQDHLTKLREKNQTDD